MSLHEKWKEISLDPPSAFRSRELVVDARTAAVAVETERSRRLAPAIAALYFNTARGAAQLVPVLDVVVGLAAALDRGHTTDSDYGPQTILEHASIAATQLVDQPRAVMHENPEAVASTESRQLAARVATDLLEVHSLHPSIESFHSYGSRRWLCIRCSFQVHDFRCC